MMTPGAPALCEGTVWHRRLSPVEHRFEQPVTFVWLDPDAPEELTSRHPCWSHRRPAPARFRRTDYGDGSKRPLSWFVRDVVEGELGFRPTGPIRMLTQIRRWGWLFNPITVYVVWDRDPERPAAVVLEVTNTPWHERHHYAAALVQRPDDLGRYRARVTKVMHVSPFLDEEFEYEVELVTETGGRLVALAIDVVRPGTLETVLMTGLSIDPRAVTRRALGRSLRSRVPTHRVSAGIYIQAMRLWRRGVVFVPHPSRRTGR
jgi:DUF1365 family protein